jgi:hypothetical protein
MEFIQYRYGKLNQSIILITTCEMDGYMVSIDNAKVTASTFIKIEDQETRIEKLQLKTGQDKIRLSAWKGDKVSSHSIILSEEELLDLLHQAIDSGVLPRNFIGKLREKIEI